MGIMPPDAVTIAISGSYGSIEGDMSAFTVTPGLRLFPGSNGGPEGPGREIQTYTPNGTSGATVTFTKPFTGSYPTGTKFYIAEGPPSGSAAFLSNQVQKMISYFAGIFGQDLSIDGGSSQQLALRRAAGGTFARLGFYLGLSGSTLTFLFGSRNVAGREVMSLQASPNGVQLVDALEVDRETGGVNFRSAEVEIASAATCDLGSVRARRVLVSGGATIGSFGAAAWQEKTVRFGGQAKIVHHAASLALPASRDVTTLPGDVAVFASDGAGNWRCLSYQRADGSPIAASFGRPDPRAFTTVEPTIDLDFKEGFSHPNYGRTTTKLRRDARGMISGVPANVAAIEYNEAGLLLGARFDPHTKNQDLYSNNFDQSVWIKNEVDPFNIGVASPDGFLNAWKLVPKATSGPKYIAQSVAVESAQRHSLSVFAKAAELTEIGLHIDNHPGPDMGIARFDLLAGTASVVAQSDTGSEQPRALIVPYRGGWYRCSITFKADSNVYPNQRSIIYPFRNGGHVFTGNGSDGVFIHRAQHEPSPHPTPTVDTLGSAVTRGADLFSIPIGNWFNPEEGSIYLEARVEMDSRGYPRFVTFTDGTLNNVIDNYLTSYYADLVGVGIVSQGVNTGGIESPNRYTPYGSVLKFCYGYTRASLRSCLNGGGVSEGTMSAFPNITQLDVGHVAGIAQTGGWLRRVLYFPRKLSALEMQRMTAL